MVVTLTAGEGLGLGSWIWLVHSAVIGLMILAIRHRYRRDLAGMRRLLREHDRMVCPRCHYPLEARAAQCPECGSAATREEVIRIWSTWERELDERTKGTSAP